jgi:hypothetical protein
MITTATAADGVVILECDGRSDVIRLEIDEATQRRAVIEAKLNGYQRLFEARPTWQQLFVVPSPNGLAGFGPSPSRPARPWCRAPRLNKTGGTVAA